MKRRSFALSLCLLAAVTAALLLLMGHSYPATLSRLLTGNTQSTPAMVSVTSWPNDRKNTFVIDDPALLEQLWALTRDVPLAISDQPAPHFPSEGYYRFSLDGGREVLTDGIYLYVGDRTYTARTLPALLSLLYRADEKAQFYTTENAFLPPQEYSTNWNGLFYSEMETFGLDSPGEFYVLGQREDGLWWCYTSERSDQSLENLLTHRNIRFPRQLGSYQLTRVSDTDFYWDDELWQFGMVMCLKGDFEPGQIYDWSDKLTLQLVSADYVGPAENPEHHKPDCPGLSVTVHRTPVEDWIPDPPEAYTEEPPFDGSTLCEELAGWQVQKVYSYAMGIQFEKGWYFTSPDGCLSARFAKLMEVSDLTDIDWYHQALHRDMTPEELASEGQWLLPLLDVADSMK